VVIALLLHLHHSLEHLTIRFLSSQKLQELRKNYPPENWFIRQKNAATD
jgi:hypothetical protein